MVEDLKKAVAETSRTNELVLYRVSSICHSLFIIQMSYRRRGGPTGHAKKSQSSPDVLVEETVTDTTEESYSTETLVDQIDSLDSVYHTSFLLDNNSEARQTPL